MIKQYRKQWLKWHGSYENKVRVIFQRTFKEIANDIPFDKMSVNTYKAYLETHISKEKILKSYVKVYEEVGTVHGKRIGKQINKQINQKNFTIDGFLSEFQKTLMQWLVKNGGRRIVSVRRSYAEYLTQIITKGIEDGKSMALIASDMQKTIKSRNFYRWQSLRIARTETTAASNYAATVSSSVSGVLMDKVWISALDKRTRRAPKSSYDHYAMNRVRVPLDKPFNVSGENLMFAGAPLTVEGNRTSGGNVINCRCSIAQVVRRDSDGNIMLSGANKPVSSGFVKPIVRTVKPNLGTVNPNVFRAAKTLKEAEDRMLSTGSVKNVNLKGLKKEEYNEVLRIFEKENKFSKMNLDSIVTYRNARDGANALYSPSNNKIALNISNLRKRVKNDIVSYENQLLKYDKMLTDYKDNYVGNVRYNQRQVITRMNSLKRRINVIDRKIKDGEKARYWSISSSFENQIDALGSTFTHEIGHYRHFKQLGETRFLGYSKLRSVSEYGRTNDKEYLAEWYTHYRYFGEQGVPEVLLKLFKSL